MPKVWNKRDKNAPKDAVYVGRPSPYGNYYVIGKDGTREEVVQKFRDSLSKLSGALYDRMMSRLRGKDLVCWCAPKPCHADVLLELANVEETTDL